uniref:DNA primase n=1 Tax=Arsenophonus endosymbiont of Trialeurodes vaporariorum TaxID=235567 RepID=A0A3B0M3M9_9GAMM
MITITELSERLWLDVVRVAKYLLPEGKKEGHEWVAGSVHGEQGKSLKVNLSGKKVWSDFAEGTGEIYSIYGCRSWTVVCIRRWQRQNSF